MSKRFVDTELYDKPWFNSLSCRLKCAVQYIFGKCDSAGIWEPNYVIAAAYVGEGGFVETEILEIDGGQQFEKLPSGKIFVVGFCDFQYGNLSDDCKPHRPVIQKLKKQGLYERVLKGFRKGIDTLQEKEKEKEKVKEQDFGKSENLLDKSAIVPEMVKQFTEVNTEYPVDQETDFPAIREIAVKIQSWQKGAGPISEPKNAAEIKLRWGELVNFIRADDHYRGYSITRLNKHFQSIVQSYNSQKDGTFKQPPPSGDAKLGTSAARVKAARDW
jgi:hypothetical protein